MIPTSRGRQTLSRYPQQQCEIVIGRRSGAQVFNGILAVSYRLLSSHDRTIESLQCFVRSLLEHVAGCLKLKHQSMQALKQTVVQFPRDTCALVDTFFQTKFKDAARYGPAKEGGDEKRRDSRYRHDRKNPPLHSVHVHDGLCKFPTGLLLNGVNQY